MALRMPENKRCAACLTFDVDGLILWLGMMGARTGGVLSRGEFGLRVGLPRILDLLDEFGVKATFFWPGHSARTFPDSIAQCAHRGHEVATHSMYHLPQEVSDRTPLEEKRRYLSEQVELVERATGTRPQGFRSSGEWTSDDVPNLLMEMGFVYDSSFMGDDFSPYRLRIGDKVEREEPYTVEFGHESALLEFPWQWDLDDFPHFEFISYYLATEKSRRSGWPPSTTCTGRCPVGCFTWCFTHSASAKGSGSCSWRRCSSTSPPGRTCGLRR
jgi:hypothetical protein